MSRLKFCVVPVGIFAVGFYIVSLSNIASVWLLFSYYLVYYYLVSLFVDNTFRKNIIGVETFVNTRLTTLAEDFTDLVWYDVVYVG